MQLFNYRLLVCSFVCVILGYFPVSAVSQERYTRTIEAEFEDVFFDLEGQIVDRGLVVEHVGHVGKMLERTSEAVTGDTSSASKVYKAAKYLQFCSAGLTHESVSQDPANLSICPFVLYAYETNAAAGKTVIGYRNPDFGKMPANEPLVKKVHSFLRSIIDDIAAEYE